MNAYPALTFWISLVNYQGKKENFIYYSMINRKVPIKQCQFLKMLKPPRI